jgi:hypothetical protein
MVEIGHRQTRRQPLGREARKYQYETHPASFHDPLRTVMPLHQDRESTPDWVSNINPFQSADHHQPPGGRHPVKTIHHVSFTHRLGSLPVTAA